MHRSLKDTYTLVDWLGGELLGDMEQDIPSQGQFLPAAPSMLRAVVCNPFKAVPTMKSPRAR